MDQSTPSKPVMDVTPPKPAEPVTSAKDTTTAVLPPTNPDPTSKDTGPAAHGGPSSASAANATSTGSLPTASPATVREPTRSSEALATQPAESELVGGSTGAAPVSDRTRTPEAGAVHAAPPLSDDDKPTEAPKQDDAPAQMPASSAHAVPKSHGPAAAITFVVLAMILLSALAILVYLNS